MTALPYARGYPKRNNMRRGSVYSGKPGNMKRILPSLLTRHRQVATEVVKLSNGPYDGQKYRMRAYLLATLEIRVGKYCGFYNDRGVWLCSL